MIRVLMVGSSPTERGGMATVTNLLLRHGSQVASIRMVPTHREGPAAMRLRLWLTGTAQVVKSLRYADLLHAHVSERGSVVRKGVLVWIAKLFGKPVLLHCHGAEFVDWYQGLPGLAKRLIASTFQQADLVAVLGSSWRTTYIELLGLRRVVSLGNPVELPRTVPSTKPGFRIVFLGRFGARKGSADVLSAVAGLSAPVELVMAGDGEVTETRALAAWLGVDAQIRSWISPGERDALLAGAHVFVLPSKDEGLPMALLEAMGHGLVPVVTPVGSIGEVVRDGENGLLVRPGDVPGLTRALQSLMDDPALLARLGKAARSTVEPFAIENYMRTLGRHWERLVTA
ncbi:glycosyltransferase family 4 protein [Kibdelosporangium persicum]|uniref:Glycosyltransferase involved in cell wall biosynthesis n=1 Tax=Kibdelosporangium persicum TaxID=2698649 RepID=A0ABX2FBE1_9PSEU|nr:glycosyltransferase family 4 protein [Kibdelosporangium persicum]NRN68691.1 Glycosyltransferase involved in cell wall biosynthesis [Kibdelosporangium persicum]